MINLFQLKATETPLDNHYQLIEKIGGGGFSEVWLATDLRSQVKVALKVYSSVQEMDAEGITMFRKEFSLVCNLNHTNILKPFSFDIFQGCPYIVLPYCEKGSAAQYVGKIGEDELWDFAGQVAAGLAYIHKHNIIHQDIKPGNVLINADGQMMITDFGISTGLRKTMRRSHSSDESAKDGTIAYMSYECLKANPINVISRDIWAFGATLYELLMGDVPFGEYGGLTQNSEKGKAPKMKNNISKEMKELILRCLAIEPWDRPNAEEIVKIVAEHQNGIRHETRNFPKNMLIGALVVVVLGFGGWYLVPKIESEKVPVSSQKLTVRTNPNDSILLAEVKEAESIIKKEKSKNIDKRNEQKLCLAAQKYSSAIKLNVTDSIRQEAIAIWGNSQETINETYKYLYDRGVEYANIGAESAANTFGKRCKLLQKFVSAPNK